MNGPDLERWHAFTPSEVLVRMKDIAVPWYIVGGWALDLFLGRKSREHEDIEICILRGDFEAVAEAFADCDFHCARNAEVWRLKKGGILPSDVHQVWCLDRKRGEWKLDIMLESGTPDTWIYKRDARIRIPRSKMVIRDCEGIPFLRPEAVLLFKAKAMRPKDEADFTIVASKLEKADWLVSELKRLHPCHPWIADLEKLAELGPL